MKKSVAESMARTILEWDYEKDELIQDVWADRLTINIGPQHPSTHGVIRLVVILDGEVVNKIQPHCGYLHRSIEKISENRTILQIMPFTDRIDYVASMNANHAFSLAAERLIGIEVPERAQYVRVIMAELNRIASHLLWWGDLAHNLGAMTPFFYAFREREMILGLFEQVCGSRMTYNYIRPGGVSHDLPEGWEGQCRDFLDYLLKRLPEYHRLLTNNAIFQMRTRRIGNINAEEALSWGLSGPSLRGSGIRFDVRKHEPYDIYKKLHFNVPIGRRGDCFDRYMVRMNEIEESVRIVRQCLRRLPRAEGSHTKKVSMLVKCPDREAFVRTEAPRGEMSVYIRGSNEVKPWRVKYRTASFSNIAALDQMCRGHKVADLMAIFGSLDVIAPEVDR